MSDQGRMLGGVALNSPVVAVSEPAGDGGTARVRPHTVAARVRTRVVTQGLSRRDLQVLAFVGRFRQVTQQHVDAHLFKTNRSATPSYRTLSRLVDRDLLAIIRLDRRGGGVNGGNAPFVYQIGPAGWRDQFPGKQYRLATAVSYHTLDIASVFIDIDQNYKVIRYETEPESHRTIAHMELKPDLFVELDMGKYVQRVRLEVDLGTERPRQLKDKMSRYHYGLEHASNKQRRGWPTVLWVVPDEQRRAELESLIKLEPAESRGMYRVCLFGDVVETLKS